MNRGDSRVLHLCVENDALVTNGLRKNSDVKCATVSLVQKVQGKITVRAAWKLQVGRALKSATFVVGRLLAAIGPDTRKASEVEKRTTIKKIHSEYFKEQELSANLNYYYYYLAMQRYQRRIYQDTKIPVKLGRQSSRGGESHADDDDDGRGE